MKYFLLVYDRAAGRLLECRAYPESNYEEALARRFELELEASGDSSKEIVVLGAASEEELRKTHSRYFASPSQIVSAKK